MTLLGLTVAALSAPAGQAAFPDFDGDEAPAPPQLADRVRHEPAPPPAEGAIEATGPAQTITGSNGFDWADAGIGAGIALGGMAFLGGGVVAVKRAGRRDPLTTQ
jgi:hypothetical protein